ncbi:phosphatase PAP2 family protein [Winogradskyella bathintestinalis]|uniref:Phosphatase PAP2 family protein n=1 Tax=Winogradskyella bathintestinalis TaxID=3035208 RepID=A0ABT7ZYD4_9FLAO|nr:phosphatase PAP2 family protein [Winogradskyella bathintestinalis]MDN3493916.1 phosphatase PAP2 family protein [Winogradskyella bathintestinalis]
MQNEIRSLIHQFRQLLSRLFKKYDDKLPYIILSIIAILLVVGGIKIFVELTENLKTTTLGEFDTNTSTYIHSFRNATLTDYFIFITNVGDVYGYLVVFILCNLSFILIFKNWQYVIQLSIVLVLALSSNVILKKIINRSRPELEHLVTVETLSYPSGHAMTAMAFYGFLIYLFYRFKINPISKTIIIILLSFLILSIGISRIYLGVHFPSDILGGFIAGFIWVILCALIFNFIRVFRRDPKT